MRLIKQVKLYFQEGRSDKVYEVDLCELDAQRYVVNFRYGRRDTTLKEGAKTLSPVALAQAEQIFADLVAVKVKKGYQEEASAGQPIAAVRPATSATGGLTAAQSQSILQRLTADNRTPSDGRLRQIVNYLLGVSRLTTKKKYWPLERIIWRVGELRLTAAVPALINLIGTGATKGNQQELRDYSIAWALGQCDDVSAIAPLTQLYQQHRSPAVRRIAAEALSRLSDPATLAEFRRDLIAQLPSQLQNWARSGPAADFTAALTNYLQTASRQQFTVLDTLYLINNEMVRPALLAIARRAPLAPPYFQALRHIFKMAEYRRDAEMFGLLAYRWETERARFREPRYIYGSSKVNGNYYVYHYYSDASYYSEKKNDIKSPDTQLAYGDFTRNYLRRRVWRTLRRLAALSDPDYVKMAVGVLLPFTDADAQPPRTSTTGRWDQFAAYYSLNQILYRNSPRYYLPKGFNNFIWRCKGRYRPADPEPNVREEAFPKLWEQRPNGLLHLLSDSQCRVIHEFAAKALRDCHQFNDTLPNDAILMLLQANYEVTAEVGFEIVQRRYRGASALAVEELLPALLDCKFAPARMQACQWIKQQPAHFQQNAKLMVALITSNYEDVRRQARHWIITLSWEDRLARLLIGRLIAYLCNLSAADEARARDIAEVLRLGFESWLAQLGLEVIRDLLTYPLAPVQELGAQILLHSPRPVTAVPSELVAIMVASNNSVLRATGAQLIDRLPDEVLNNCEDLLANLVLHEYEDIRQAATGIIRRLMANTFQLSFAARLVRHLLHSLLTVESTAAARNSAVALITQYLMNELIMQLDNRLMLRLLNASAAEIQELAGLALQTKLQVDAAWADNFEISDLVAFAEHELSAVRAAAKILLARIVPRCQRQHNAQSEVELAKLIRLLDVQWDDMRQYVIQTFAQQFDGADFTPALLIAVCDSTRSDVQQLGRKLITKFFQKAHGAEYLLKLSEHPAPDLQLFVTNYLEKYAAGNLAILQQLTPYFLSVLCRVNQARMAKERVLEFLAGEAQRNGAVAAWVGDLLARQVVTMAVTHKARIIEIMCQIKQDYPAVRLPLEIVAVPLKENRYHGV